MKIAVPAVIKKDGKWYQGFLNGFTFAVIKDIMKLSDIKNVSDYKWLTTFLKEKGLDEKLADEIKEKIKCESVYVLDKPIDLTPIQMQQYLWYDFFWMCKRCKKSCKQSHIIKELSCKDYEP